MWPCPGGCGAISKAWFDSCLVCFISFEGPGHKLFPIELQKSSLPSVPFSFPALSLCQSPSRDFPNSWGLPGVGEGTARLPPAHLANEAFGASRKGLGLLPKSLPLPQGGLSPPICSGPVPNLPVLPHFLIS